MYYMNLIDLICFVTGVCLMNCHMNRQSVVVFIMCVCVCVCVRACVQAFVVNVHTFKKHCFKL